MSITNERKRELTAAARSAFPRTIPVLVGFLVLGIAYGVLMQTKGYDVGWSALMSAVAFCGSMQFAAIPLLGSVFRPLEAFLLSLMVNARHLFYGISMLPRYRGTGRVRPLLIFWLCDETFSICSGTEVPLGVRKRDFYFFISLFNYLYWVLGTVCGGLVGSLLSFPTKGLDFTLTALFVVLFLDAVRLRENRLAGAIGIVLSLLARFLFGAGNMVLPAMGFLLLALLLTGRKKKC